MSAHSVSIDPVPIDSVSIDSVSIGSVGHLAHARRRDSAAPVFERTDSSSAPDPSARVFSASS